MNKILKLAEKFENKLGIKKTATVNQLVNLLNSYEDTASFLQDLVLAQYEMIGEVPNNPNPENIDSYQCAVEVAEIITSIIIDVRNVEDSFK